MIIFAIRLILAPVLLALAIVLSAVYAVWAIGVWIVTGEPQRITTHLPEMLSNKK